MSSTATVAIHPDDPTPPSQERVVRMASFVVYLDHIGEFRWYLIADDRKVAESAQGYRVRQECEDDIRLMKRRASKAVIESKAKPVETLIA